jgi:hypothetical protein
VLAALLSSSVLLQAACLPLDDLSSYSSAWERPSDEAANSQSADASASGADLGDGGVNGGDDPLDASRPSSPTPDAGDGGPERDAGSSPAPGDGGFDAGAPAPDAAP